MSGDVPAASHRYRAPGVVLLFLPLVRTEWYLYLLYTSSCLIDQIYLHRHFSRLDPCGNMFSTVLWLLPQLIGTSHVSLAPGSTESILHTLRTERLIHCEPRRHKAWATFFHPGPALRHT
ncbi:hypothetical protein BJ166DRAFT_115739 [Pestalotiopsis sp. NC0098]|nr:hypothetical protein BJ166DRAFT_115739 [Pestalotiopsis sp. NC0098]